MFVHDGGTCTQLALRPIIYCHGKAPEIPPFGNYKLYQYMAGNAMLKKVLSASWQAFVPSTGGVHIASGIAGAPTRGQGRVEPDSDDDDADEGGRKMGTKRAKKLRRKETEEANFLRDLGEGVGQYYAAKSKTLVSAPVQSTGPTTADRTAQFQAYDILSRNTNGPDLTPAKAADKKKLNSIMTSAMLQWVGQSLQAPVGEGTETGSGSSLAVPPATPVEDVGEVTVPFTHGYVDELPPLPENSDNGSGD
eukprot:Plantae.Rhodophyta-Palmaria_palmata.ctg3298.p1 GENE.Plantae.Rhodophyta-Palmaria_palmata.ctg3298~~Plantae.Rhodophyta-Palmaria_palmata.ctg3298.p1  ORF type:complete len:262 (-),score=26.14 Plantae.Rhodophyta-Palmaria_palmata.ctg3298:53-802(-)